jgi:hypothetical protein
MEIRNDCKEYFKVKITRRTDDHFVAFRNGKYEKIPGRIRMGLSVRDSTHGDIIDLLATLRTIKDTRPIKLERFDEIIKGLNLESNINATITYEQRINKLQHKLESLKYHIKKCVEQEKNYESKYKNEYVNTIVDLEEIDPVFVYETESFLFQTKSTLDVLAQIIAIEYRLTGIVTFGEDGKDVIDQIIKSSAHRDHPEQKEEMIKIIKRSESWIRNLVFMRDLITHYGDLMGFKSITHSAAFDEDEFATVSYPTMPDRERVTTFMNNTWINVTQLIKEVSRNIAELYSKVS